MPTQTLSNIRVGWKNTIEGVTSRTMAKMAAIPIAGALVASTLVNGTLLLNGVGVPAAIPVILATAKLAGIMGGTMAGVGAAGVTVAAATGALTAPGDLATRPTDSPAAGPTGKTLG